ncbi:phosphotransferase [Tessaracoccus sp. OH4464_COT-324]|uniref:phosphotransferase n=1 Tax=Tessaracoccus sp. OH4464_COT-324 TaxID=2491059 RepID=UPI00131A0754|nr:phosphotransferase [Tessaracoccus sp. OH4464_COT-324]
MTIDEELWRLVRDARWFGGRGRGGRLSEVASFPQGKVTSLLAHVEYADNTTEIYHVPVLTDSLPGIREAVDHPLALWPLAAPSLPPPKSGRRFAGEQSNTSLFYDNSTLMKVLRRVEPGRGIEAELLEALRGSGAAPELLGVWEHGGFALGLLVEALPRAVDGYDVCVAAARSGECFQTSAADLGHQLAKVHSLLAERLPTAEQSGEALRRVFTQRFESAVAELPQLAQFVEAAASVFANLPEQVVTQRVHGDCHLGQVLQSDGRWCYVDFEGEPMKTLAERRQPDSSLRDIAGMLRSFHYAACAGQAPKGWLADAESAFLDGYGATADGLLSAYIIDKACYEAVYEARFRPHMLRVPLSALGSLLGISG